MSGTARYTTRRSRAAYDGPGAASAAGRPQLQERRRKGVNGVAPQTGV